MGYYNCLNVTELDSHANMSVAGSGSTVIARSGHVATVTPFSPDLPVLEKVEIGDTAKCYDDPVSLQTYILVLRNALLIPTMSHNLLPPFLVCEASLFLLDETPKHQAMLPTIDNHLIYNSRMGMRTHLQLQGIFSVFPTCLLSLEESENWENYPVVFITPNGNSWDLHSTHFVKEEAAMVDHFDVLVKRSMQPRSEIFDYVDVGELYGSPVSWDCFDEVASHVAYNDPVCGYAFDADEVARLDLDGIQAQLAMLDIRIFCNGINGMGTHISCIYGYG